MGSYRPSPAIVVPADMPIGDTIRKMKHHDVGSVLVVREVLPHDLVGIFTERDLLRTIDQIQHGGYWDKGIAAVMTKPVISLSVFELGKAPEIMNRCHIRHLPVVYNDEYEQKHIVGVISMRDLFQGYYETGAKSSLESQSKFHPKIGLASLNEQSVGMLRTILSQGGKADVVEMKPDNLFDHFKNYLLSERVDLLVVDLDFVAPARWARFLQGINHEPGAPTCVLLFTPDLHDAKNTAVLNKLSDAGKITAFAKPINVLGFLQKLESAL
jgi:signal-transduction protein with cAMP-binding, CBS, and nucleotidyltransferase domain